MFILKFYLFFVIKEIDRDSNLCMIGLIVISISFVNLETFGDLGWLSDVWIWKVFVVHISILGKNGTGTLEHAKASVKRLRKFKSEYKTSISFIIQYIINFSFYSSEQRIDCFVINLSPIRSHIEYIGRHLWETLAFSLRSSILDDISLLHDFTTSSLNVLQHIPNDEAGILSASLEYEKITSNFSDKQIALF